jgi:hypothetical protein
MVGDGSGVDGEGLTSSSTGCADDGPVHGRRRRRKNLERAEGFERGFGCLGAVADLGDAAGLSWAVEADLGAVSVGDMDASSDLSVLSFS